MSQKTVWTWGSIVNSILIITVLSLFVFIDITITKALVIIVMLFLAVTTLFKGLHDLRLKKKAKTDLKTTEDDYNKLAEYATVGIFRLNSQNEITYANVELAEILEYQSVDNVISDKKGFQFESQKDHNILFQVFKNNKPLEDFEVNLISCKNNIKTVLISAHLHKNEIHGTINDITEQVAAEKQLEVERKSFRTVVNALPQIIYVVDPSTYEVLMVNKHFEKLLGKNPVGKKCYEEFQRLDKPCEFCTNETLFINKGEPHSWEHHNPVFNKDYMVTDQLIKWPDGRDVCMELAIDITERRRLKEQYETLIKTSIDGFWVCEADGKIIEVNDAFCKMLGYSSEELLGMNIFDIEFKNSMEETSKQMSRIKTQGYDRFETIHKCKDGTPINVDISAHYLDFDEGRFYVFTRDITETVKSAQLIEEKEKTLQLAIDAQNAGVWIWKISTGEVIWDDTMMKLFDTDPDTFQGDYSAWKELVHHEDLEKAEKGIRETLEGKNNYNMIYRVKTREGDWRYLKTQAILIKDELGKPEKMTGICLDVTDQKLSEQKLNTLLQDLERSNKDLEQFAYVASHDLQEPLRMVASYSQLLARRYKDKLDQDANDFINYSVDGATRMQKLINDLLMFSRINTRGKEFQPTDCQQVLGKVISNIQTHIEESNAVITNDNLPTVVADDSQLTQLFQNLIQNAIKFRGENHPHVHIGCKKNENEWVFCVADNGIGIDPEYHDQIFTIFKRLNPKDQYPGTGIGLAVCKKIVERAGGKMWIESNLGEGSKFYFTLPVREEKNYVEHCETY